MAKPSSIRDLPDSIRSQIDFMISEGKWTIDQIVDYLSEAGHPKSRSAVGRYKKNLDQVASKLRQSREITDALVKEVGEKTVDGQQGRLLVEMMRSIVFDFLSNTMESEKEVEPQDFMFLAKSMESMSKANQFDLDFEMKIAKKYADEAAKKVDKIAKQKGISADVRDAIKESILGVALKKEA